uniref:zinc finger protein 236 isoform X2 n=1 Tax=Myxine glutinosa TaxID=7769 RepID=UPI00358F8E70
MPRGRPPKHHTQEADTGGTVCLGVEQVDRTADVMGKAHLVCDVCTQVFTKHSQLQRHLRQHQENDKPFRCEQCSSTFNIEHNLELHRATHQIDRLACPDCGRAFSRVASLKAHIMLHQQEENLMCGECGDEFILQAQLERHMDMHRQELGGRTFNCRLCQHPFDCVHGLREHMCTHYTMRALLSARSYKRNIDRSGFVHRCVHCGKTFQKPSQLVRHIRIHTGERPFKCEECGKAFNQKGVLQIHMAKHTGERPYRCAFCPHTFSQRGNLRAHIQRVHANVKPGEQPVFQCEECSCVFKKLGSLNAHISRMHAEESFTIQLLPDTPQGAGSIVQAGHTPQGGRAMTDVIQQLLELSEHVTSDPTQNATFGLDSAISHDILQQALANSGLTAIPLETPTVEGLVTGQQQQQPQQQQQHQQQTMVLANARPSLPGRSRLHGLATQGGMQTKGGSKESGSNARHTCTSLSAYRVSQYTAGTWRRVNGIRWYMCPYCNKEFKKPSDLVRHIRIHTHEKPYKCTMCFRTFAVKSTLTAHVKTHTGLKEFKCSMCEKLFSTQGSLRVHLRLHTGAKPFDCPHCDKKFRTSGHRKSHVASHFKDSHLRRQRFPRKPSRARQKGSAGFSDIPLQEPILITESGLIQQAPRSNQMYSSYLPDGVLTDAPACDRPYTCNFCSKAFKKSSHLKQHVRSHTGERPYHCGQCSRSFVSSGVLKAHVRTHTGLKAYRCCICNGSFTTNGSLKRHMSTHSETRPFMCPYCQKTFKTSVNCKKHMKTHRYELAQQLQQPSSLSDDSLVEPLTTHRAEVQSSVSSQQPLLGLAQQSTVSQEDVLRMAQPSTVNTEQQDLLGLAQPGPPPSQQQQQQQDLLGLSQQGVEHQQQALLGLSGQSPTQQEALLGLAQPNSAQQQAILRLGQSDANQQALLRLGPAGSGQQQDLLELAHQPSVSTQSTEIGSPLSEQTLDAGLSQDTFVPAQHVMPTNMESFTHQPYDQQALTQGFTITESYGQQGQFSAVQQLQASSTLESQTLAAGFSSAGMLSSLPDTASVEVQLSADEFHAVADAGMRRSYRCGFCNKCFKKSSHLKQHIRSHTGEKPFKCNQCGRNFVSSGVLKGHLRTHVGEKIFKCNVCGSSFTTNISLTRHMAMHTKGQPFKCPFCEQRFRSMPLYKKHIHAAHQDVPVEHGPGEDCGEGDQQLLAGDGGGLRCAARRQRLGLLTLSSEEAAQLACSRPDQAASVSERLLVQSAAERDRVSEMKEPGMTAEDEPRHAHSCSYCPKSFKKPSDLLRHLRIHTGEKPFKCDECGKSFTLKSTLDCHMKTHTGQKHFHCHICDSHFSTKGSLKVHMRLHTGAKPFKCPHCEQRFRTSGHRKSHIQSHLKPATSPNHGTTQHQKDEQRPGPNQNAGEGFPAAVDHGIVTSSTGLLPTSQFEAGILQPASIVSQALLPASIAAGDLTVSLSDSGLATLQSLEGIQLQLSGASLLTQNVQIAGLDATSLNNITLQIDPGLLQQTIQQSSLISQAMPCDTTSGNTALALQDGQLSAEDAQGTVGVVLRAVGLQAGDGDGASSLSNVVLQAADGPSMVFRSVAGLTTTTATSTAAANASQDIPQILSPQAITSASGNQHEITLTIVNPNSSSPQSVTLTISGQQELLQNQVEETDTTDTSLTTTTQGLTTQAPSDPAIPVGSETVTLTLTEELSGSLDPVTQNLTQGQQFGSMLAGQGQDNNQHIMFVDHQPGITTPDYQDCRVIGVMGDEEEERDSQGSSSGIEALSCSEPGEISIRDSVHMCRLCGKGFKRAAHLTEHVMTHKATIQVSRPKPRLYKCESCGKYFCKPSQLKRHIRIHTGEKPFQCQICSKAFSQTNTLQIHMKKHTDDQADEDDGSVDLSAVVNEIF